MGYIVPPPPVRRDGKDLVLWYAGKAPPLHPWPWLCLYCHTVQPADKTACCNCGAPKPQREAQQ